MQTISITQTQTDLSHIFQSMQAEPVIVKNSTGANFLVVPFSEKNWQEIFLILSKSFHEILEPQSETKKEITKTTGNQFLQKWSGFIKNSVSDDMKEDYTNYLMDKYK